MMVIFAEKTQKIANFLCLMTIFKKYFNQEQYEVL